MFAIFLFVCLFLLLFLFFISHSRFTRFDTSLHFSKIGLAHRLCKFQNGCLTFCQCYTGCDKHDRKNTILKTTKDAYRFGITLFKRKRWWNLMNLLNSSGNWLLILIQVIQTIVAELTIFKLQQNLKALEQNYTKTIIHSRLSEDCWIMKQI